MLQIICRMVTYHHLRSLDRYELEGHFADNAGEPHAAHGSPENFRIFSGGTGFLAAIGHDQLDADDMLTEGAVMMMVFAMHVGSDAATQRYKFGAGSHRHEPSLFYDHGQNIGQGHAGFGAQDALLHI